jgi:hypothetical protein
LAARPPEWGSLWAAAGLDVLWLAGGFLFARSMFGLFRRRGYVTRYM